ncbi:MAG TPA: serine/threonine-protein kinase, partial [Kofleriaceae bacterium]
MDQRDVATLPDAGEEGDQPPRLGHFEIVGRLGAGGMGMVFEGRDTVLHRRVALKILHPSRVGGAIAPARLLREAQALAKLSHANVVTVFEVGMAGDDPFVAMELVEGETLLAWMDHPHTWRDVLDVFLAVGRGLAAVHALGLVHRDFKPSNVLIDGRGVPKLGDFGLVATVDEPATAILGGDTASSQTLTLSGSVLGTPAYMAPEQALGHAVDARADQFSFAKSLIEVLPDGAPAALQPILARALAEDPADRYPEMAPLLDALARVRRGNRARW